MNSTLVIVLVANIGFDTAENEHSDVSEKYWLLNGSVCEACERYTKLLRICFVGAAENLGPDELVLKVHARAELHERIRAGGGTRLCFLGHK